MGQETGKVIEVPQGHYTRREEREVQLPAVGNQTPMAMLAVAVQKGMDVQTIKGLMDLQERWEKNEAAKAYNRALAAFKAEAVEIIKRKRVHFINKAGATTDYKHAELADVIEAIGPALSKHGFAWGWKTKQEGGRIEVTCELRHELGHMETVTLSAPPDDSGGKNTVQQIVSTVTYLERHTLKAATGVSEKGEDNDGAGARKGMPDDELDSWIKRIEKTTTKEAAKAEWKEAVKSAEKHRDQAAAKALKDALIAHGAFIEKAGK